MRRLRRRRVREVRGSITSCGDTRSSPGRRLKLADAFWADALIPALNRMGFSPVGVFRLDVGQGTPTYYVLIPGSSVEALSVIDLRLVEDAAFMKAAAPFWSAPAAAPAFVRYESSLLVAFEGWPKLTVPASTAAKGEEDVSAKDV